MRYQFTLAERLPPALATAFPELTITAGARGTVLHGPIPNQEHPHRLIRRFPAYGLTLVEMSRLPK